MLQELETRIRELGGNIYTVAVMTDDGLETLRLVPANRCQDSYSVAKLYTTTAIGKLWDAGKLSMDDRIVDILGAHMPADADPNWQKVTVDHALRHRIGFETDCMDIDTMDASKFDSLDYLSIVLRHPVPQEPGEFRKYTDAAFYLLSRVVGEVAGMPLDKYLDDMLFRQFRCREIAWSRCPAGHPIGATGLYIPTHDMVKLGWAYMNGGVYEGERIFSEAWAKLAMERGYELYPMGEKFIGKGGMCGQKVMFHKTKRLAVAWHAYVNDGDALGKLLALLEEQE